MKKLVIAASAALMTLAMAVPALAIDAVYPEFKDAAMTGAIDVSTCDLRAYLIDSADYTYDAGHDFLDDVPAAARVAQSPQLTTVTVTAGTLDTADFTWTSVTGDVVEAVILACFTGTDATSRLIAHFDAGLTGFPFTPNGGDFNFAVDPAGWLTL